MSIKQHKPESAAIERQFDKIVCVYDKLNRILSLGQDLHWRKKALADINLSGDIKALDLCAGTGDMALAVVNRYPQNVSSLVAVDFSHEMLKVFQHKIRSLDASFNSHIVTINADALHLPFSPEHFDLITVAFGIRNLSHLEESLLEIRRVLKPEGRLSIVELGKVSTPLVYPFWWFYINYFITGIGALLSMTQEYAYLSKSIQHFPPPAIVADMLSHAGFVNIQHRRSLFGSVNYFISQK